MQGFLAYIMPVHGGPVDPGYGVPGWPSHPIAPGGQPPGIWGGPGSLPPWAMPPIAPGGQPPTWGGRPPPGYISGGPDSLPGQPPHVSGGPGSLPPSVMPPIYIPPTPPNQPPIDPPDPDNVTWHSGWTPTQGWVTVGIVTPDAPTVTPSTAAPR